MKRDKRSGAGGILAVKEDRQSGTGVISSVKSEKGSERLRAWLFWIFLLALTGAAAVFSTNMAVKAAFFILLILPFCSLLTAHFAGKHLSAAFSLPVSTEKSRASEGAITLHNSGFLSCPGASVVFSVKNELTGEVSEHRAMLSAPSRGSASAAFAFSPRHCGMQTFSVLKAELTDWFGLFRIPAALPAKSGVMVLPETFPANVAVEMPYSESGDEENADPLRGTDDPTVISALRDYQPGDPIRRIHWKMTAKRDFPIVKEISRPVSRSLLLFWKKNGGLAPESTDALAEAFSSVMLSLAAQGIPFTAGWLDRSGIHFEEINSEEDALSVIPQSVRLGASENIDAMKAENVPEETDERGKTGQAYSNVLGTEMQKAAKTIWFAGEYPFEEEPFLSRESAVFLCGTEPLPMGDRYTVTFAPEETEEIFGAVRI